MYKGLIFCLVIYDLALSPSISSAKSLQLNHKKKKASVFKKMKQKVGKFTKKTFVLAYKAGGKTFRAGARMMPLALAKKLVKYDYESTKPNSVYKPHITDLYNSRDENQVQATCAAIRAIPYLGASIPTLGLLSYGPVTWAPSKRPAVVAKYGVAGAALPYSTLSGNPIAMATNAVVNLSYSMSDLTQAMAWQKIVWSAEKKAGIQSPPNRLPPFLR